ncbi:MAG: hypothetical protein NVSMB3_12240 [Acidobacteriaceae bacterium]
MRAGVPLHQLPLRQGHGGEERQASLQGGVVDGLGMQLGLKPPLEPYPFDLRQISGPRSKRHAIERMQRLLLGGEVVAPRF